MRKLKTWNEIRKINSKISSIELELMKEQQPATSDYRTIGMLNLIPIAQAKRTFQDTEKSTFLREELDSLHSQKEALKAA